MHAVNDVQEEKGIASVRPNFRHNVEVSGHAPTVFISKEVTPSVRFTETWMGLNSEWSPDPPVAQCID